MAQLSPYASLGQKLREYRLQKMREGIKTIARRLNLTHSYISKIENGLQRPSFDLLNKLVRHYSLSAMETNELYHLAGHIVQIGKGVNVMKDEKSIKGTQDLNINLPAIPVLYCDSAFVTANRFGIVFDFAQSMMGPRNQHNVVARVGMSVEHAKALLEVLKGKLEPKSSPSKN